MRGAKPKSARLSDLPKRLVSQLYRQIAIYGECAYRRGYQDAVEHLSNPNSMGVDEKFAKKLRLSSENRVMEVFAGNFVRRLPASLMKYSIYRRIQLERVGDLISELEYLNEKYETEKK